MDNRFTRSVSKSESAKENTQQPKNQPRRWEGRISVRVINPRMIRLINLTPLLSAPVRGKGAMRTIAGSHQKKNSKSAMREIIMFNENDGRYECLPYSGDNICGREHARPTNTLAS